MGVEKPRIDIGDELEALCAKFGLEKRNVAAIHFLPDRVRIRHYLTNDEGHKYLFTDEDGRERIAELTFEEKVLT